MLKLNMEKCWLTREKSGNLWERRERLDAIRINCSLSSKDVQGETKDKLTNCYGKGMSAETRPRLILIV